MLRKLGVHFLSLIILLPSPDAESGQRAGVFIEYSGTCGRTQQCVNIIQTLWQNTYQRIISKYIVVSTCSYTTKYSTVNVRLPIVVYWCTAKMQYPGLIFVSDIYNSMWDALHANLDLQVQKSLSFIHTTNVLHYITVLPHRGYRMIFNTDEISDHMYIYKIKNSETPRSRCAESLLWTLFCIFTRISSN